MAMKVLFPGALSTFQDQGRIGFQKYGITSSGSMDVRSAAMANALVGNDPKEAVLEMTVLGPILQFSSPAVAAVAGAPMPLTLNQKPVPMNTSFSIQPGDLLSFGGVSAGCRSYLAVKGGFALEPVMGSCSTNIKCRIGGFQGRPLNSGDEIPLSLEDPGSFTPKTLPVISCPKEVTLRTVAGPQEESFTEAGKQTFYSSAYQVSDSADRMGYKLIGTPVENTGSVDIISDGIVFGSVQIPPSGMPIVMMADHQTTGGYAKIATVISCDLPLLAQTKPGDTVRFAPVSIQEAQDLRRTFAENLKRFWN